MDYAHDVLAIGNAIVDVLGHTDDAFLRQHDVPKGGMVLIDADKAHAITEALKATAQVAGGMVGNSCAVLASLGGRARFVGKVGDDALGAVYRQSMAEVGVAFDTPPHPAMPTGRCLISVTPDAERSMATSLGAAGHVAEDDVREEDVATARVTFLEGFLFEAEGSRAAFEKVVRLVRQGEGQTALTLCDTGVVERQGEALSAFVRDGVDLLFANEAEAMALTGEGSADAAVAALRGMVASAAVTLGERGSVTFADGAEPVAVPAVRPDRLVDTTGAGDAYAGGYLFGLARGADPAGRARFGSLAASEVIGHMGPRPEHDLAAMAAEAGF